MIKNIKKFISNLLNSLNGLRISLNEHSFISEIILGILLIPVLILVEIDSFVRLLIITTYFLLLAFELINTSIEKLCNKITREIDNEIKEIKDLSSASVFIILVILVVLILFTFIKSILIKFTSLNLCFLSNIKSLIKKLLLFS